MRGYGSIRSTLAGIDPRTLQRWRQNDGLVRGDQRPDAIRQAPSHALTKEERACIVEVANQPRFAETPLARIVPMLGDEGVYIASESSFHRVLRAHGQMNRRGRARPPRRSRPPTTHIATRPGAVQLQPVPAPEPSSFALLASSITGVAGLVWCRRRKPTGTSQQVTSL
jgi:hypothetical protein